ncbi:MAG TPA: 50S ribosomal protein L28 [Candidatus Jacksonbacteria bacterium]|nr:50S ribosomal protein L28 [Candidatus Jacksonbacteria bacterium]HCC49966.1 50S ribosomal protein L28 [Candidatus Jacksonbacteria bacterium]HCE48827.1 50S ribosomal protein L28 [Candidatus Jacksonbacteria bacterium]HCR15576.1 50S ribosomal protein L28 [Candidatus Jacksonbacteria bacterium]
MSECNFCQKTHGTGNNVPHSKKKTKRSVRANLQTRTVKGCRVKVCTTCIKSLPTLTL